jgi:squalene-hopene/tetraprenyl-beta-curcumene cyclase
MSINHAFAIFLGTTIAVLNTSYADSDVTQPTPVALAAQSKQVQAEAAIRKGVAFLLSTQQDNGAWSKNEFPALTAFPLWALTRSGADAVVAPIAKATAFVTSCVSDGGMFKGAIYVPVRETKGGGLINYNTAVCMAALHATGDAQYQQIILDARAFLSRSQYDGKQVHHGGMGYDPPTGRSYADLSNSYIAYEAMHLTRDIEDQRKGERVSLDWEAAIAFVQRCHNDPNFNDQSWASSEKSEQGGFAYRPDEFRKNSGATTNAAGLVTFRTMPGMTYAGLLSYIYAGVERDDPRVKATINWIANNWQLERGNRNPDMQGKPEEKEGLYYMYNVITKGLSAYGQDELTLADGTKLNWREAMLEKLLALQAEDGSWSNSNGRYWESDKNLVTAYMLLAMETCLGR